MSGVRRQPGIVSVVDVGCAVWSTQRHYAGSGDPIGGLVVAVIERPDFDSGEIERGFLVFDHVTTRPFLRWHNLSEDEVDQETIEALDVSALKKACRRLAEEIGFTAPFNRRHGQPSPYEARCAVALATLMEIAIGPEGRIGSQKVLNPIALATMWRQLAEDVFHTRGVFTLDTARRAFAVQELTALVFGGEGLLHAELEQPVRETVPAAPRPSYPPHPGLVDD